MRKALEIFLMILCGIVFVGSIYLSTYMPQI